MQIGKNRCCTLGSLSIAGADKLSVWTGFHLDNGHANVFVALSILINTHSRCNC